MTADQRPDKTAFDVLHAPWRDAYMRALSADLKAVGDDARRATDSGCFLAEYWANPDDDENNHVVARLGDGPLGGMILLNRYPYANGHLLVALGDGRPRLLDYDPEQQAALFALIALATDLAERTLEPQGVNVGINQGGAAGAGVPQHLHAHVVPRWNGDVNFISVVGQVRVIPSALERMAERYRETWNRLRAERSS